ncbi:hypothetical protein JOF56_000653 [Kibdelosporangium banguiense]|uniref:Uncharacterized protein n=1 Tax=Kibdelosporangium banguiense TaxID=1365924 RepID=A0ABS4T790_9PSEU|nr:hypothetical protein [Kibdelosporangium banguiense]MBP2320268.1 hypothetical protein [Kibdelosporangium banguiense]
MQTVGSTVAAPPRPVWERIVAFHECDPSAPAPAGGGNEYFTRLRVLLLNRTEEGFHALKRAEKAAGVRRVE